MQQCVYAESPQVVVFCQPLSDGHSHRVELGNHLGRQTRERGEVIAAVTKAAGRAAWQANQL
jgi:hypothetical protein